MLPCQHNACNKCIIKGDHGASGYFSCPKDYSAIEGIHQAEKNNELFTKVKLRKRKLVLKHEAIEKQKNVNAEAVIKFENAKERQTALNLIVQEIPRRDQPNYPPMSEYEKIDGFHEKPFGADQILQEMQQEELEMNEEAGKTNTKVDELKKIEM